jgi:hypothetical protein
LLPVIQKSSLLVGKRPTFFLVRQKPYIFERVIADDFFAKGTKERGKDSDLSIIFSTYQLSYFRVFFVIVYEDYDLNTLF